MAIINCKKCGEDNPSTNTYCGKCGNALHKNFVKDITPITSVAESSKKDSFNQNINRNFTPKKIRSLAILGVIVVLIIGMVIYNRVDRANNIATFSSIAQKYIDENKYTEAITALESLNRLAYSSENDIKISELNLKIVEEKVAELLKHNSYEEAVAIYNELSTKYPNLKNEVDNKISSISKLKAEYELNLKVEQSNKDFEEGENLYKKSKFEDALSKYKSVIKEDTKNYDPAQDKIKLIAGKLVPTLINEAKTAYSKKQYALAVDKIEQAYILKSDPDIKNLKDKYNNTNNEYIAEQAAQQAYAEAQEKMKTYEYGTGNIGIACSIKTSKSFGDYTAAEGYIFVQVAVGAYNQGGSTEHVNPNDFTLSDANGLTVNPDTQTTYSLSNYFDAIDLPSKGEASGWLIFHIKKSGSYTLHYSGFSSSVDKNIVVK